jgi:putative aminopeptidase FrvX
MPTSTVHTKAITDAVVTRTIDYLALPCVVGHEQFFLNYLYQEYADCGLTTIRHDGLLEVHGKDPASALVCAHIDRHGLISIGQGEYVYAAQYMKEIKYGQHNKTSQKEIIDLTKRFEGEQIYVYDPATGERLGSGIIKTCDAWLLKGDAMFEVKGLEDIELGLPLAYARTGRVEKNLFRGQLDNAISLGTVRTLFDNGFQGTVLFSTEEEIGKSWTKILSWLEKNYIISDKIIVLDTSPYNNSDPVDQGMIIFRNRDMSEKFNADLVTALKTRAEQLKIPYQFKDEYLIANGKNTRQLGSTELGRLIQGTKRKWSGATIQIPTLMYHTSNETTSLQAIDSFYTFLSNILMDDPIDLRYGLEGARKKAGQ